MKKLATLLLLLVLPMLVYSQKNEITADKAVEIALRNNFGLKASAQRLHQSKQLVGSGIDIDKTDFYYSKDQNNFAPNNIPLDVWGVRQSFQFPTVYGAQRKVMQGKSQLVSDQFEMDKRMVTKEVFKAYYEIVYWQQMYKNYSYLDSLYTAFEYAANRRFEQGESNYLEKLTAETKKKEISLQLNQIIESTRKSYVVLNQWLQTDTAFKVSDTQFERIVLIQLDTVNHPGLNYYEDAMQLSHKMLALEKHKVLPDLNVSLFRGANNGAGRQAYWGVEVGVSIPLWFGSQKSNIAAAKTDTFIMESERRNYKIQLNSKYLELQSDLRQFEEGVSYYELTGKHLSEETIFHAEQAFKNGEIHFLQYIQLLENAKIIETNYLTSLFKYNMTVLEANFLMN